MVGTFLFNNRAFCETNVSAPAALEAVLVTANLAALLSIVGLFLNQLVGQKFKAFAMNLMAVSIAERVLEVQTHLNTFRDAFLEQIGSAEDTLVPLLHLGARFLHGKRGLGVVICIDSEDHCISNTEQISVRFDNGFVGVYDQKSFSTEFTYAKSTPGFVRLAHFKGAIVHITHEGVPISPEVLEAVFWVLKAIDEETAAIWETETSGQNPVESDSISMELVRF